jgi:hypothetical protein
MEIAQVGYYEGRNKARVPVQKGSIRAALGERTDTLRIETLEGMIVLTHPADPSFRDRDG